MNFTRQQFERAAQRFFQENSKQFEKFYSPRLLQTVVDAMQLPSTTAAKIAFDRLVADGTLQRTDGRTERDDARQAVAAAEASLTATVAKVDAPPLTRDELELFGSLSHQDLANRYWDNDGFNEFRVRYDRAVREFGYRVPARPQAAEAQSSVGEVGLTAQQYHAIPARDLQIKLRNPQFKFAVMKLIRTGQI